MKIAALGFHMRFKVDVFKPVGKLSAIISKKLSLDGQYLMYLL